MPYTDTHIFPSYFSNSVIYNLALLAYLLLLKLRAIRLLCLVSLPGNHHVATARAPGPGPGNHHVAMARTPGSRLALAPLIYQPLAMQNFVKRVASSAASAETKEKKARPRGASAAQDAGIESDSDDGKSKRVSKNQLVAIGRLSVETARIVRALQAAVYLTFVFPVCCISADVTQAGINFAAEAIDKVSKKNKKMKKPPSCHKWCAMIVSTIDLVGLKKSEYKDEKLNKLTDAEDVLKNHSSNVPSIDKLDAVRLHCESRITHDETHCILILSSMAYPEVVAAMQVVMSIVLNTEASEGPAPPSKAERKVMGLIKGGKGKD